jgi:hypothetical protein
MGRKMNAAEITALVTAFATCITAVGGVIIAIRTSGVRRTVDETHALVNQRYTDLVTYQEKLTSTLQEAGVKIPGDMSLKREQ